MTDISAVRVKQLMSRDRDLQHVHPVKMRYLICSAPRVGSNILCALLRQTNQAGDPLEYLNPIYITADPDFGPRKPLNVIAYWENIEARRTSSNGVFGAKVHYGHLPLIFKNRHPAVMKFLARFDKVIVMRRHDKLSQAISLYKAERSGFWTDEDRRRAAEAGGAHHPVPFDPVGIANCLMRVIAQDVGWRGLLEQTGKAYTEVTYEELAADPAAALQSVASYLEISPDLAADDMRLPARQSDAENQALRRKFLRFCGASRQKASA